jgi:sterol desaturase/sphingolipid hydroxylase (fatty acid hydroxylase superfamily)
LTALRRGSGLRHRTFDPTPNKRKRVAVRTPHVTLDGHPPEARTDLIRRLGSSTFNYWFGYVANLALVIWMVSHAFSLGGEAHPRMSGVAFAVEAAVGLFAWTLAEYLLHRYMYHAWPSFLSEGHTLHHQRPRDLIGIPWYLTTVGIIVIFKLVSWPFDPAATGVVMGFCWLGYIFYCVTHHGSHHWRLRRGWLKTMQMHHLIHHGHDESNWGFTTTLWDHVFGTYYRRPVQPRPARAEPADG